MSLNNYIKQYWQMKNIYLILLMEIFVTFHTNANPLRNSAENYSQAECVTQRLGHDSAIENV